MWTIFQINAETNFRETFFVCLRSFFMLFQAFRNEGVRRQAQARAQAQAQAREKTSPKNKKHNDELLKLDDVVFDYEGNIMWVYYLLFIQ